MYAHYHIITPLSWGSRSVRVVDHTRSYDASISKNESEQEGHRGQAHADIQTYWGSGIRHMARVMVARRVFVRVWVQGTGGFLGYMPNMPPQAMPHVRQSRAVH